MSVETKIELTPSQEIGLDKITKFLESEHRIFLLEGPPGAGKTFINKIALKEYIDADINSGATGSDINVAGICLAHQAKNVLGNHIPNVFTFASAFGMKEVFHDDGSRSFEYNKWQVDIPIGECSIPIFVHDEISQYNSAMTKIMLEKTSMFSKIILIGDIAQLPPIEPPGSTRPVDADSPIFDLEIPEECKHTLTDIVRQKEGNSILELSREIRKEILGSQNIKRVFELINRPKMIDGEGFDFLPYGERLYEHIKSKDLLKIKVIAFRKKTVEYFNFEIRNYLLNSPEPRIIENDIICMLDNYYHRSDRNSNEVSFVLHNSDMFKLERVFERTLKHQIGQKTYRVDVHQGTIVGDKNRFVVVPTNFGQSKLEEYKKEISDLCRGGKIPWKLFWDFHKRFCNCGYGYAVTAYKCQGSTYETVYVDINDIFLTRPLTPKRKLQTIYTAMTRASKDVYFLNSKL